MKKKIIVYRNLASNLYWTQLNLYLVMLIVTWRRRVIMKNIFATTKKAALNSAQVKLTCV